MADSGVDTSNESSDNQNLDHSPGIIEFNPLANSVSVTGNRRIATDFFGKPNEFIGKIKCYTKARHCRIKYRQYSSICLSRDLRLAASINNSELVEKLLLHGADPNSSDDHKRSPLHFAACRGYVDVVKILLNHGANPNIKDTLGNTPLHLAACTNHVPVVIELLDAGTDVSSNDKNGRNPIQLAYSKLKLFQMRPNGAGNHDETRQYIKEIQSVIEMMLKYMKLQKMHENIENADLESIRQRLERISTREQAESEVQNLLDSLDSLKLK